MKLSRHVTLLVVVMAFAAIVIATTLIRVPSIHAQGSSDDHSDSRIERGFDIAPVPLNLEGKNRALVGLGSYLVNAVAACNDCHDAGPQTQYEPGGNPFFGQRKKINPATYLGGGQDFGPLLPTFPQLNAGQDRSSRRGTTLLRLSPNDENRGGFGSRTSAVLLDRDDQLPSAPIRRQSSADHALAHVPEPE